MSRAYPFARLSVRKLAWILLPVLLLAASAAVFFSVRQQRAPVRAVRRTLDQIRHFDPEAAGALISAGDSMRTDPEQAEALQKFFEHFDYKILSCRKQGKTAEIKVRFKNIDTRALASDMRSEMLRGSLSVPGTETSAAVSKSKFLLLFKNIHQFSVFRINNLFFCYRNWWSWYDSWGRIE